MRMPHLRILKRRGENMKKWLRYTGYAVVSTMMFWIYQIYTTDKSDLGVLKMLVLIAVSVGIIILGRNNDDSELSDISR